MTNVERLRRTCIVTGAASGLGRVIAFGLAEAGATVIAADLNFDALQAMAADADGIVPFRVDLSIPEECEQLIENAAARFPELEGLVNCAGLNMAIFSKSFLAQPVRFWDVNPAKWQLLYDVNVRAPFLLARRLAPRMIARGWGRIVNITTSFSSMLRSGNTPYGQAKAALEAATAGWAEDLAGTGVTANVLIPGGAADTPMIPMDAPIDRSRLVNPSIMTPPILHLMSDASNDVTGMRFDASKWSGIKDLATNLERAMTPAAWPGLAAGHRRPALDPR